MVKSSKCRASGFGFNIIQVSRHLLDHFVSFFDKQPFFSTNMTEGQIGRSRDWCNWDDKEEAFWLAVRKKISAPSTFELPATVL